MAWPSHAGTPADALPPPPKPSYPLPPGWVWELTAHTVAETHYRKIERQREIVVWRDVPVMRWFSEPVTEEAYVNTSRIVPYPVVTPVHRIEARPSTVMVPVAAWQDVRPVRVWYQTSVPGTAKVDHGCYEWVPCCSHEPGSECCAQRLFRGPTAPSCVASDFRCVQGATACQATGACTTWLPGIAWGCGLCGGRHGSRPDWPGVSPFTFGGGSAYTWAGGYGGAGGWGLGAACGSVGAGYAPLPLVLHVPRFASGGCLELPGCRHGCRLRRTWVSKVVEVPAPVTRLKSYVVYRPSEPIEVVRPVTNVAIIPVTDYLRRTEVRVESMTRAYPVTEFRKFPAVTLKSVPEKKLVTVSELEPYRVERTVPVWVPRREAGAGASTEPGERGA